MCVHVRIASEAFQAGCVDVNAAVGNGEVVLAQALDVGVKTVLCGPEEEHESMEKHFRWNAFEIAAQQ